VEEVSQRIEEGHGRLDAMANGAWGGYEKMIEDGEFTWPNPFWLHPSRIGRR